MKFERKNTKIYILSGKAQSGKDVLAKIITETYKDKKVVSLAYSYYLKDYIKRITNWNGSDETKPRELMQQMGIELIKNKINSKLLINRLIEDIEIFSYFYDVIIITDARLVEEIEIPKEKFKNVTTIRVNRVDENVLTEKQKEHITETALDNYDKFNFVIINNNDYEDLRIKVVEVIKGVDENA